MIKLNYKRKRSDQANPIIASFEKNVPAKELVESLDFEVLEHIEPKKKQKSTILSSSNDEKFSFLGKSLEHSQGTKYLVGILGNNNQMELHDVDSIYSLEQTLKSDQQLGSIDTNIAKSGASIFELKQNLVAAEMAEYLKDKSSALQDKLEAEMDELKKQEQNQKREFLPEFDLSAADPPKIYDIRSLITQEEFDALKCEPIMIALKQTQQEKKNAALLPLIQHFHVYTKDLLLNFEDTFSQVSKYKASKSFIIKYIMYLDFLLKFAAKKQFNKSNIEQVAKEVKVDLLYARNIIQKYYQATPQNDNQMLFIRSQALTDKLICHIIVLSLFMFGFDMDCSYLGLVLRIDQRKLISYSKEIGCTVNVRDNKNKKAKTPNEVLIQLKAPLKLQPNKKPAKDKK